MSGKKNTIPNARTAFDDLAVAGRRGCDRHGCGGEGLHRAPKDRSEGAAHYWFCRQHAREYNAAWDYFEGWSEADIVRFQAQAVTGHRPTWPLCGRIPGADGLDGGFGGAIDPFGLFSANGQGGRPESGRPLAEKARRALAEMDLDASASLQDIKMRYKQLVKRFHPDANGGDKRAEERFKTINEAYSRLLDCGLF